MMAERHHPRMKHLQLIANGAAWPFIGYARNYHQAHFASQARTTSPRIRKGIRVAASVATSIVPVVPLPPPFIYQTAHHPAHEQVTSASTYVRLSRTTVQDTPVDDTPVERCSVDDECYEPLAIDLADIQVCDDRDATPKIVNWLVDSPPDPLRRDIYSVSETSKTCSDRSSSYPTKHVCPHVTPARPCPSPSSSTVAPSSSFSSFPLARHLPSSANSSSSSSSSTSSSHRIGVVARPEAATASMASAEMQSSQVCRIDGWRRSFADEFDSPPSSMTTPLDFQCHLCLKRYSTVGAARLHARTHTLPCRCPACGKAFSRPWLLRGHWRTHTGERPFQCPDPGCRRAFADRSNLRAHLQTHATVKKYCCGRCPKTFSRVSLLVKHKRTCCA